MNTPHQPETVTTSYPPKPFVLSPKRSSALETIAGQLLAEALQASDDFVLKDRVVSSERWKLVKEKGTMTAYRDRHVRPDRSHRVDREMVEMSSVQQARTGFDGECVVQAKASSAGQQARESEQGALEKAQVQNIPLVFATGVVPGTVEDAALGFLADTDLRGRMRYSNDKNVVVEDTRILAKIREPTPEHPFRFLGIKWSSHESPTRGVIVKARDYVILESTGMVLDSKGERVAYLLNHSIELDEVPSYRRFGQVRTTFSVCNLIRPHAAPGSVEVFSRGFLDAGGRIPERMGTTGFCDGLLSLPHFIEESYLKKLAWLLCVEHHRGSSSSSDSGSGSVRIGSDSLSENTAETTPGSRAACTCCEKKFQAGLAKFLASNTTCGLCRRLVCQRCTVKKTLPVDAAPGEPLVTRDMTFCVHCYLKARDLPARRVALASVPKHSRETRVSQRPVEP